MKLTISNLQQKKFQLEIDPAITVKCLKKKIEAEKGKDYPSDGQILIYSGQILADEIPVSDYNIDETKCIIMIIRPMLKGKVEDGQLAVSKVGDGDAQAAVSKVGDGDRQSGSVVRNPSLIGAACSVMVPPRNADQVDEQQTTAVNPLEYLKYQPEFFQVREIIRRKPHLLNYFMQQIRENNPEQFEIILENHEIFVRMLTDPSPAGSDDCHCCKRPTNRTLHTSVNKNSSGKANETGYKAGDEMGASTRDKGGKAVGEVKKKAAKKEENKVDRAEGNAISVSKNKDGEKEEVEPKGVVERGVLPLTQEDKDAIERLKTLGWTENLVVLIYHICEKDENMAADFLKFLNKRH